jgi:hypothetical protein
MKHESDILKQIKNYFMRRKNATEAYEFEREIEKDAFLYEAVEGFEGMHVPDMQQALDELDMLVDKKAKPSVFEFVNWRIAATVLAVIVGGATLISLGLNYSSSPSVADEDTSENQYEPRTDQMEYTTIPDSIHIINFDISQDSMALAAEEQVEPEAPAYAANDEPKAKEIREDAVQVEKPELKRELIEDLADAEELELETNEENNANLDYEEIIDSDSELSPRRVALETTQSLSAPVTVGNNLSKSASYEESAIGTSDKKISVPTVAPAGYKKYISSNLKKSEEMQPGTVTLSFEFDRNGNPKKINVDKSLCDACDKEAIRLIEAGPAWNAEDRKTRVSYTISIP